MRRIRSRLHERGSAECMAPQTGDMS
jgi:hypothetical protein